MTFNILLLCGGDGTEHSISLMSADFVESCLKQTPSFNVIRACLHQGDYILADGFHGYFARGRNFVTSVGSVAIDCVVPCIHGTPGETGELQSALKLSGIPYIGCDSESSSICFDKLTTKLYFNEAGIANTPFVSIFAFDEEGRSKALQAFDTWHDIYIKAASQGSSVGCYHVTRREDVTDTLAEAFQFSRTVIIEKNIEHRELEIAAFECNDGLHMSRPGEIIMPGNTFYTYEEKYSSDSGTVTTVEPQGLSEKTVADMQAMARRAFEVLKLRDLSRIDFFLTDEGEILLNEINTFPGMTKISMFPKLVEHEGVSMVDFFRDCVLRAMGSQA